MKRRVEQAFEDHLKRLEDDMSVSLLLFRFLVTVHGTKSIYVTSIQKALGKISYTMDMWSDPNLSPFMAVTAHWIEGETIQTVSSEFVALRLRSELVGFVNVPVRHTGEHLAEAFLSVIDRLHITYKVRFLISS